MLQVFLHPGDKRVARSDATIMPVLHDVQLMHVKRLRSKHVQKLNENDIGHLGTLHTGTLAPGQ